MNKNKVYILNPEYILKNDVNKILLYSKTRNTTDVKFDKVTFIHPVQAAILSFFTHLRSWEENIILISEFISKTPENTDRMLLPFCENKEAFYLNYNGTKIFIPSYILIDKDRVSSEYEMPCLSIKQLKCEKIDLTSMRINTAPSSLTLMLTNKCLTHCTYCYADTKTIVSKMMSTDRILDIIDQAEELRMKNINLIGGEIFIHKDWHIILKSLIDKKLCPDILSTKYPITQDIISKLKKIGFNNRIQFSLDSLSSDVLEKTLVVDKDYINRVKKGIILLNKNKISFQIATIVTKYNVDIIQIKTLYEFLKDLTMLKSWEIRPAMNSLYQNSSNFDDIKADKKIIIDLYEYITHNISPESSFPIHLIRNVIDKEYFESARGSFSFKGARCSALNSHMFVLPDGKVTICEQLYWNPNFIIGDLLTQNIVDVWHSPRAEYLAKIKNEFIQEKSACKKCSIFSECFSSNNRCWADVIKAYGSKNWDFPDPRCSYAPKMIHKLNY